MPEQTITCPHCGKSIELSSAFTHQIEEKYRTRLQAEVKKKDDELKKKDEELKKTLESTKKEFREAYDKEIEKIKSQSVQQAKESLDTELKDLKSRLMEKEKQLSVAQEQELALRKRQRELEEKERALKLEVQRTLDEERTKIWESAAKRASEDQHMKMLEKEKQLSDMHKQVEEMRRKIELTSQQAQGEVQELELESLLKSAFRFDSIEPVAKGVRGADVMQEVRDDKGTLCGTIIWESKRTKLWSDGWIQKLKDDQRAAKAEIAVIVTSALPQDIKTIGNVQGIWVANYASAIGLATALRYSLIQLAYARSSTAGKNDKMELMYNYLSGPEFKQRIEAIVETFTTMKTELDTERRAIEKIWAKREMQISRVIQSTVGMYGDLQGIMGASLLQIDTLELPDATLLS